MPEATSNIAPDWRALEVVFAAFEKAGDTPDYAREFVVTNCASEAIPWRCREPADPPERFWQSDPAIFTINRSDVTNIAASMPTPIVYAKVTLRKVELDWRAVVRLRPDLVETTAEAEDDESSVASARPLTDDDLRGLPKHQAVFWQIVNRIFPGASLYAAIESGPAIVKNQIDDLWKAEFAARFPGAKVGESPSSKSIKRWIADSR